MPRLGRLHIPGGCYHIMSRGLERRNVFDKRDDKIDFLERLGISLKETDTLCFAWAIMSNHYHLLIRAGAQPLSKLMSPLLTGYANNYNRRHHRCGYVFQNRYKSILCDEDEYLMQLIRYIHLNPWKAGIVLNLSALNDYPWTGHAGLQGKHVQKWHSIETVLKLFSEKKREARQFYLDFITDEMQNKKPVNLSGGGLVRSNGGWDNIQNIRREHENRLGDERILGNTDFVEAILKEDTLTLTKQARNEFDGWNMQTLSTAICLHYNVNKECLTSRGRNNNLSFARLLIAYFAVKELSLNSLDIEIQLNVTQSAVSKMVKKGALICGRENISLTDFLVQR